MPVALNSGLFWPRRSLRLLPGTIVVEVLDPIPPGLDKDAFFTRLRNAIEAASNRLLQESASQESGVRKLNLPDCLTPDA